MQEPVVLGLDFGGTKIAIAVAEITGERLGSLTIDALSEHGATVGLQRGIDSARALHEQCAAGRPLLAVGACTFGIPREDRIDLAPTVAGWSELALGTELAKAFAGTEIRLATDVKAAAQAEYESGALAGCDPSIYLNLGTGLAAAVIANGVVLAGQNGAAGEIGYNLRTRSDVSLALEQRQTLEEAVSGKALMREALERIPTLSGPTEVFAEAGQDGRLARVLADFIEELSFHLVNLTIAIDPVRIAVGGGMVRAWDQLHPRLRQALDAAAPYPPELVLAQNPYDAPLLGAIAMATAAARDIIDRESDVARSSRPRTTQIRKGVSP